MAKPIGGLSSGEIKTLRFLRKYIKDHGYSPTYAEIGVATGYTSKAGVSGNIAHLERGGLIQRTPGKRQGLQVTAAGMRVEIPEPTNG